MNITKTLTLLCICLLLYSCARDVASVEELNEEVIKELPMNEVALNDLSFFNNNGDNWSVAGDIYADFSDKNSFQVTEGSGILVNKMREGKNTPLYSGSDHGDLEIAFEYLMPKGSNSGLYFQERYELQLHDSYGVKDAGISHSAAIYERWDDTKADGEQGYEGSPPSVNTSKAPGLWQMMKIMFRAPRFSEQGEKVANARFEYVYHNGVRVQENVEVTGPTRGGKEGSEVEYAPFYFQGDHGNIAIRNIRYKSYTQDTLKLTDINYAYFEHDHGTDYPDFDTVTITKQGEIRSLDVEAANERTDHYGMILKGSLVIPVTGDYVFHMRVDDGGELLIDNKLVLQDEVASEFTHSYGRIHLEKDTLPLEIRYYENVWASKLELSYEGPRIYKQKLAQKVLPPKDEKPYEPILIREVNATELIRSFVWYDGSKKTHTISVGSPSRIHYTYDLKEGALLQCWKGDFADVTRMWKDRGYEQVLVPMNGTVRGSETSPFSAESGEAPSLIGYDLNDIGEPTFKYKSGDLEWTDHLHPADDGSTLKRTITLTSGDKETRAFIASEPNMSLLPNGYYSADGQYYLKVADAAADESSLTKSLNPSESVTYEIFW